MESAVVYALTCQVNGSSYVGATLYWYQRQHSHLGALRCGKHYNKRLQAAFNQYGEAQFEFEVLEVCEAHKRFKRESRWIKKLKTLNPHFGYNIRGRK